MTATTCLCGGLGRICDHPCDHCTCPPSIPTYVVCGDCNGVGLVYGAYRGIAGCETEESRCRACDGEGQIIYEPDAFADETEAA